MTDLQEILGRVIRQERQNRDLTMKELGEQAGLSEIYIGEIERGQKYPSAKVLESLARALDVDLAELFELMAGEIRKEREPQITQVIGFTYKRGKTRRSTQRIVNMLGGYNNVESEEDLLDFSTFLLSRQLTPV
jgi:transcriptional regulator with XRE-family HTH domain